MRNSIIVVVAIAILGLVANHFHSRPTAQAPVSPSTTKSQTAQSAGSSTKPTSYKDGTFTGNAAETPFGTVQVAAVISGGKISDINFLQLPSDQRESQQVSSYAKPYLKQAALSKQGAKIDFVSGATSTTYGFEESLQAALNQAAS